MATTGQKFPTLGESVAETPWLDNTWTTPTNIYTENGSTANVTATSFDTPDQTYVLKATGFDFSSIPDSSTINGVICRTNAWYRTGQGSGAIDLLQLLNTSKVRVGSSQCFTPVALTVNTSTIITKGSSTDLWGNALTPAWVKNLSFGVGLGIIARAANADVDVDYITLEIDYTPPAGSSIIKKIVETVGMTDVARKARGLSRRTVEPMVVSDVARKARSLARRIVEAVGISDVAQSRVLRFLVKVMNEVVGLSDGARRSLNFVRMTAESVGISDLARKTRSLARSIIEAIGIADVSQSKTFRLLVKIKNEFVGIADGVRRSFKFSRIKVEMVSLYENVRLARRLSRIVSEIVGIADKAMVTRSLVRMVSEMVGIADASAKSMYRIIKKIVVEVVGISENVKSTLSDIIALIIESTARTFRLGSAAAKFRFDNATRSLTAFFESHTFKGGK
jgi:hypothetical protein